MGYFKKVLSVIICAAVMLCMLPAGASAAEADVTVTIFATNDIHGAVEGSETAIGLAQAAAIKASTPNALLVDAGDATQGASFATISQGEDVIRLMNAAGYDVMTAGNHEFDYGAERLLSNAEAADFPVLSANVTLNGEPLLPASVVVEVGGKAIGFIGLTTVNTATSTNPSKLSGVEFGSEVTAAKEQIKALADNTDTIVIICHLGDNNAAAACTSADLLDSLSDEELSEVAAVVDGHSHTVEDKLYERNGVSIPVIQTGTQMTALGKIELTFADGVVTAVGTVLDLEGAANYTLTDAGKTAAAAVQTALENAKSAQAEILDEVLCENAAPLWGGYIYWDFAETRVVETNYGDFVADAFAASANDFAARNNISLPVIAATNGGGISATLPMGVVTRGDVLNAFNHGNMAEVLEITPSQLYAALEAGLNTFTGQDDNGTLLFTRHNGSFLQVSGFSYSFDPAGKAGAKVTSVHLADGTALSVTDTDTKLLLATNSYVSAKLDAKKALGELGGEDQVIMEYILSLTEDSSQLSYPADQRRITIAGDKSPDTYTVKLPVLSDKDVETAIPNAKVTLGTDGGDFKTYTTDNDGFITVTLARGVHTLCLKESADGKPVYLNNYSGAGVVTTKEGYYRFGFIADAESLSSADTGADNPPTGENDGHGLVVVISASVLAALYGRRKRVTK